MKGKKILLGVSGSIAAYKVAFLIRLLVKEGAEAQRIYIQHDGVDQVVIDPRIDIDVRRVAGLGIRRIKRICHVAQIASQVS